MYGFCAKLALGCAALGYGYEKIRNGEFVEGGAVLLGGAAALKVVDLIEDAYDSWFDDKPAE